ncbi:25S rRNA (adenine2142-N1)-methyltransferase [Lecanora helva]
MSLKKKRRPQLLSSTRPKQLKSRPALSSRATRTTVRDHHNLRKKLSAASTNGDHAEADRLRARIEELGGLNKYQQASLKGQSAQRGGDTSKVLVEWISDAVGHQIDNEGNREKLKMLEVGALSTDNACSRSSLFHVERIDLHPLQSQIRQQDFMERTIPAKETLNLDGFDIVSLSLVVNFVGDPAERGEMLRRVEAFLRTSINPQVEGFPALFLVLPASCVTNSRYLDEDRLESMMRSLGYTKTNQKMSAKLVYYLWTYRKDPTDECYAFKKEVIRTGNSRNNFAIVLR